MSLKDLPNMTAQQVFDIVATHLLTQMKQSISDRENNYGPSYLYHGPNGLKCAAGALIGDDEYQEEMEHNYWIELVNRLLVPLDHKDLICRLQKAHDSCPPEGWYNELKKVATEFNLKFNFEKPA